MERTERHSGAGLSRRRFLGLTAGATSAAAVMPLAPAATRASVGRTKAGSIGYVLGSDRLPSTRVLPWLEGATRTVVVPAVGRMQPKTMGDQVEVRVHGVLPGNDDLRKAVVRAYDRHDGDTGRRPIELWAKDERMYGSPRLFYAMTDRPLGLSLEVTDEFGNISHTNITFGREVGFVRGIYLLAIQRDAWASPVALRGGTLSRSRTSLVVSLDAVEEAPLE